MTVLTAAVYAASGRRMPVPAMVALVGAVILGVVALIVWIQWDVRRERATLQEETEAALRAFAVANRLEFVEPPTGSPAFPEVQGSCDGMPVRARVDYVATDELMTALSFPGAVLGDSAEAELAAFADRVSHDSDGVTLYLARRPGLFKPLLLDYAWLPERDPVRLSAALTRACALLDLGR